MIVLLVLVLAVVFIVMNFVDCDILITPIKGIMFGALYNVKRLCAGGDFLHKF